MTAEELRSLVEGGETLAVVESTMNAHALAKERTRALKTHGAGDVARWPNPDMGAPIRPPIKPPKSGRRDPRE